jgi:hypothetical protein
MVAGRRRAAVLRCSCSVALCVSVGSSGCHYQARAAGVRYRVNEQLRFGRVVKGFGA